MHVELELELELLYIYTYNSERKCLIEIDKKLIDLCISWENETSSQRSSTRRTFTKWYFEKYKKAAKKTIFYPNFIFKIYFFLNHQEQLFLSCRCRHLNVILLMFSFEDCLWFLLHRDTLDIGLPEWRSVERNKLCCQIKR